MKTEEIQELLELAKSFGLMVDYTEEIVNLYAPAVHKLVHRFIMGVCDLRIEAYKKYKESGLFTHEQCLSLVHETFPSTQDSLNKMKKGN